MTFSQFAERVEKDFPPPQWGVSLDAERWSYRSGNKDIHFKLFILSADDVIKWSLEAGTLDLLAAEYEARVLGSVSIVEQSALVDVQ